MKNLTGMVDLAMTPMMDGVSSPPVAGLSQSSPPAVVYPYGLAITLTKAELEKLNVDHADWSVGDHFCLDCLAKITSISEHENEGGKQCRVEMQIVAMSGEESEEGCDEDDGDDEDGY